MASSSTFVTTTNPNKWAEEKKQFLKEKFIELIIKVPLFQALSKDNLNRIADSFTEIKFNDNIGLVPRYTTSVNNILMQIQIQCPNNRPARHLQILRFCT